MEKRNRFKVMARNIWREHKQLIVLVILAAIFGVIMAAVNTWQYSNQVNVYALDQPQIINQDQTAEFEFEVSDPDELDNLVINLGIEGMGEDTQMQVTLNGQNVAQVTSGSATVRPPLEAVEEDNTVEITRTTVGFQDQTLVRADVTAMESLRQIIFVLINFAAILMVFLPAGFLKYRQYLRRRKMEEEFPGLLRDIVQGTRAGMSLPQAIQNVEPDNYDYLDTEIEKMSSQIEWGVPFDQVLERFGQRTHSSLVKRSSKTINQAYRSGGNIEEVLQAVGDNIRSIKQLEEERQSQLYGEVITGYVVYLIFIAILIALNTYLLPNLAAATEAFEGGFQVIGAEGGTNLQENIDLYEVWFQRLVFFQALFSGLIVGKLSEGELNAGFKHAAILFAIGYIATTIFI